MKQIKLNIEEMKLLVSLFSPINFSRLYMKIEGLEGISNSLDKYLNNSNYSKITKLFEEKKVIKEKIIKNQLNHLTLYEVLIKAKYNKDEKYYLLEIKNQLAVLLVESITFALKRVVIQKEKKKNEVDFMNYLNNRKNDISGFENQENLYSSILNKIEKEIKLDELYKINKSLDDKKSIDVYSEYLEGGDYACI